MIVLLTCAVPKLERWELYRGNSIAGKQELITTVCGGNKDKARIKKKKKKSSDVA